MLIDHGLYPNLLVSVLCFLLPSLGGTVYAQRTVQVSLTPDGKAHMEGYLPEKPDGRAVLVLPGGGYSHLAMQHEGYDWAPYFNRQGIACFVLTYRMPQGDRTVPVSDATNAMLHLRSHAAEYGLNPHAIGIMGSSAGGHLATTIATHASVDARPDFQILFYPVVTLRKLDTHEGSARNFLGAEREDETLIHQFSNELQVKKGQTPPAIILAASDDTAVPPVPNGVAYYAALQRAGVSAALYLYPSGGHGFGFRPSFRYHDQMLRELTSWLQSTQNTNHKTPTLNFHL